MSVVDAATKYAALNALGTAIAAEQRQAANDIVAFTTEQGITKGELNTPLGPVTLAENKASTEVVITDEDALLGWCEINLPSAIVRLAPKVNQQSREQLLTERFVRAGDQVLDSHSGEVLEFAQVRHRPAGQPTVSYRASETQRQVKAAAAKVVAAQTVELTKTIVTAHELAKAIEAGVDD